GAVDFYMCKPCTGISGKRARGADLIGDEPFNLTKRMRQPAPPKPPKVQKSRMGPDCDSFCFCGGKSFCHDFGIAGVEAACNIDASHNVEQGGVIAHAICAKTFSAIAIQIDARHDKL